MFEGRLESICTSAKKRSELSYFAEAELVAGGGLVGDRYFQEPDAGGKNKLDQEVTLIEAESLESLAVETQIQLEPRQARRNLITRDVPLNHLVGKEFRIGEVVLQGMRLCEPCGHLENLTVRGVKDGLCHRGGLRARVVKGGKIRKGDLIQIEHSLDHTMLHARRHCQGERRLHQFLRSELARWIN